MLLFGSLCLQFGSLEKRLLDALAVSPSNAKVHYNLGVLAADRGDVRRAEERYLAALVLSPTDAKVLYNLALLQQTAGRWNEALENYATTIEVSKESMMRAGSESELEADLIARSLNNQGVIYRNQSRFLEAAAVIDQARSHGNAENALFFDENLNNLFNHMPSVCENSSTYWSSVNHDEHEPTLCLSGQQPARILILGDSHTRVWHFTNHATRARHFDVCTANSVTALGLNNISSATGGLKRFRQKLRYGMGHTGPMTVGAASPSLDDLVQAEHDMQRQRKQCSGTDGGGCEHGLARGHGGYDYVAVMVGEVDLGYGVWRRSHKYNTSVAEQMRLSAGGLFNFLAEVSSFFPDPASVVVMGVVLPPMDSSETHTWELHSRSYLCSQAGRPCPTQEELTMAVRAFNDALRALCALLGYQYIDINARVSDAETRLLRTEYRNENPEDSIHLSYIKTWPFWQEALAEKLGLTSCTDDMPIVQNSGGSSKDSEMRSLQAQLGELQRKIGPLASEVREGRTEIKLLREKTRALENTFG